MNPTEIRERANQALANAREMQTRFESAESVSADERAQLDAALTEAENLFNQAGEAEARANRFRDLSTRAKGPAYAPIAQMLPHQDRNNLRGHVGGEHQYSLVRAINGQINAIEGRGGLDGLEFEVHQELLQRRGKSSGGLLVPMDAPIRYRGDLTTAAGTGAVGTYTLPTMIDLLRSRMVLAQLGCQFITDQRQQFNLPRTTTGPTASVVSTEGTGVTSTAPAIDALSFTYHSIEARTKMTRQFINGASISSEQYIANQLTQAVAHKLQYDSLNGAGSGGAPKGLLKYTNGVEGINVKALGATGANITWNDILAITGLVDTANASDVARAWLFNPTTVAYLQGVPKVAGFPKFILDDNNLVAGYGYGSTSDVPNNLSKSTSGNILSALAFGSFDDMIIGLFTGIDLMVDPFSAQPHVNVLAVVDYDMHVAHPAAWALCTDLDTVPSED